MALTKKQVTYGGITAMAIVLILSGVGTYYFEDTPAGSDICSKNAIRGEWRATALQDEGAGRFYCPREDKVLWCKEIKDYGSSKNAKCVKMNYWFQESPPLESENLTFYDVFNVSQVEVNPGIVSFEMIIPYTNLWENFTLEKEDLKQWMSFNDGCDIKNYDFFVWDEDSEVVFWNETVYCDTPIGNGSTIIKEPCDTKLLNETKDTSNWQNLPYTFNEIQVYKLKYVARKKADVGLQTCDMDFNVTLKPSGKGQVNLSSEGILAWWNTNLSNFVPVDFICYHTMCNNTLIPVIIEESSDLNATANANKSDVYLIQNNDTLIPFEMYYRNWTGNLSTDKMGTIAIYNLTVNGTGDNYTWYYGDSDAVGWGNVSNGTVVKVWDDGEDRLESDSKWATNPSYNTDTVNQNVSSLSGTNNTQTLTFGNTADWSCTWYFYDQNTGIQGNGFLEPVSAGGTVFQLGTLDGNNGNCTGDIDYCYNDGTWAETGASQDNQTWFVFSLRNDANGYDIVIDNVEYINNIGSQEDIDAINLYTGESTDRFDFFACAEGYDLNLQSTMPYYAFGPENSIDTNCTAYWDFTLSCNTSDIYRNESASCLVQPDCTNVCTGIQNTSQNCSGWVALNITSGFLVNTTDETSIYIVGEDNKTLSSTANATSHSNVTFEVKWGTDANPRGTQDITATDNINASNLLSPFFYWWKISYDCRNVTSGGTELTDVDRVIHYVNATIGSDNSTIRIVSCINTTTDLSNMTTCRYGIDRTNASQTNIEKSQMECYDVP